MNILENSEIIKEEWTLAFDKLKFKSTPPICTMENGIRNYKEMKTQNKNLENYFDTSKNDYSISKNVTKSMINKAGRLFLHVFYCPAKEEQAMLIFLKEIFMQKSPRTIFFEIKKLYNEAQKEKLSLSKFLSELGKPSNRKKNKV